MVLSKRKFRLRFQMNQRLVETLLREGVLLAAHGGIDLESAGRMQEGFHYVKCMECGSRLALVTGKHLKACSGIDQSTYKVRWPEAPLLSKLSAQRKAKTDQQKKSQSDRLKARFQTPAGAVTRQQISEAARRLMDSGYRDKVAKHLRALGKDPKIRALRSDTLQQRWDHGDLREVVERWHKDHRQTSLAMAAYARKHLQKTSRLHLGFKQALENAGVKGFLTEHPVGFYSIDEANPQLKIAVEVDGCYWHGCPVCGFPGVGDILRLDRRKTTYLTRRGWTMLRFRGHEIRGSLPRCIQRVRDKIAILEAS